jgi:hypothetical protein
MAAEGNTKQGTACEGASRSKGSITTRRMPQSRPGPQSDGVYGGNADPKDDSNRLFQGLRSGRHTRIRLHRTPCLIPVYYWRRLHPEALQ